MGTLKWNSVSRAALFFLTSGLAIPAYSSPPVSEADLLKMKASVLLGIDDIIRDQNESLGTLRIKRGYKTSDPYYPEAFDPLNGGYANPYVLDWYRGYHEDPSVCALKFTDPEALKYVLKTFPDAESAEREGYRITHTHPCGLCSSLQDLGAYIAMPNVTDISRKIARRFSAKAMRREIMKGVGLTSECAEAWAYNLLQDKRRCMKVAIREYGLFNVIIGRFKDKPQDGTSLPPSMECDEVLSGAGFKFSVGRNRRNSGLHSSIERDPSEITPVDHTHYFDFEENK